jgi:hypothetical protein
LEDSRSFWKQRRILKWVNNGEEAWLGMFDASMAVHRSSDEMLGAKLVLVGLFPL